jgi:hypothetical protein
VIAGELEITWTAGRQLHSEEQIQSLAAAMHAVLQQLAAAHAAAAAPAAPARHTHPVMATTAVRLPDFRPSRPSRGAQKSRAR